MTTALSTIGVTIGLLGFFALAASGNVPGCLWALSSALWAFGYGLACAGK